MDTEILKSYLVKLGVQVDTAGFDKIKTILGDLEKAMGKNASSGFMQLVKSSGMLAGALLVVDTIMAKTISGVAKADMSYQLLAQKMYMSVDATKAFKIATDTLGHSAAEIAWNAELKGHYMTLVKDINELQVPQEAKDMFKQVRGIGFELKRMEVIGGRAIEMIAFNLLKLNKGEMNTFSEYLKNFNESIKKNLPEWSKQIAEFLQPFIDISRSFIDFLKDTWNYFAPKVEKLLKWFKDKWKTFSENTREGIALIGVALLPLLGTVGLIAAALLLVDDYMNFTKGRASLEMMIPIWETLNDIINAAGVSLGAVGVAMSWVFSKDIRKQFPNFKKYMVRYFDEQKEVEQQKKDTALPYLKMRTAEERKSYNANIAAGGNTAMGSGISSEDDKLIQQASKESEIPAEVIRKFIMAESGGNPYAVSDTSTAVGWFQYVKGSISKDIDRNNKEQVLSQFIKDYNYNKSMLQYDLKEYNKSVLHLKDSGSRDILPEEVYLAHHEGLNGALSLINKFRKGDEKAGAEIKQWEDYYKGTKPRIEKEIKKVVKPTYSVTPFSSEKQIDVSDSKKLTPTSPSTTPSTSPSSTPLSSLYTPPSFSSLSLSKVGNNLLNSESLSGMIANYKDSLKISGQDVGNIGKSVGDQYNTTNQNTINMYIPEGMSSEEIAKAVKKEIGKDNEFKKSKTTATQLANQ